MVTVPERRGPARAKRPDAPTEREIAEGVCFLDEISEETGLQFPEVMFFVRSGALARPRDQGGRPWVPRREAEKFLQAYHAWK